MMDEPGRSGWMKAVRSIPRQSPGNRRCGANEVETMTINVKLILDVGTFPNAGAINSPGRLPQADGFLSWPLHEVVCVSVLTVSQERADPPVFSLTSFSRQNMTEAMIITGVETLLAARLDSVVTYNGRSFDLPLLQLRSQANGCITPRLRALSATRGIRSGAVHLDQLDRLCQSGAAPKAPLADFCTALSIPSKTSVFNSTSSAAPTAENKWDRIQGFSEADVLSTWLLKLTLDASDMDDFHVLQDGWAALADWLEANSDRFEHLRPFMTVPEVGFPAASGGVLGAGVVNDLVF